ncbi:MAG: inositol monophosphatase [Anaeromyxobacter sp.]|nr:inositol monophosphatase [Anaeromyxobacter sp.]MBL0277465.1 inositol monophosphatase [Anaeromyxobacter sp.]
MREAAELLAGCAAAAQAGAAVLRARWGQARTIDKKGTIDLVTDADRASEAAVLALLAERFPGAAVLAEESGASGGASGGLRFVVDPLDGTTNYAHGLPHFAVTVAASDAHGVVAGATCDPLRGELFLASRGGGATLGGVPLRCSGCAEVGEALLVTGFPYDVFQRHEVLLRVFGAAVTRARGVRRLGSAALDLAYVAAGRFDGFWEARLKPWDLAAGLLLAREAGAVVTDLEGGDRVLESGGVVAASPALQPRLLALIHQASRGEPM